MKPNKLEELINLWLLMIQGRSTQSDHIFQNNNTKEGHLTK